MSYKKVFYLIFTIFTIIFLKQSDKLLRDQISVKHIEINGCKNIKKSEIEEQDYTKNIIGKSIFKIDIESIRAQILNISLIKEAVVKRKYPHSIVIDIIEVEPVFLITNSNKESSVYDKSGKLFKIKNTDLKKYTVLESLVYIESDSILDEIAFLDDVFLNQKFTKRINTLYKVGGRRWDMIIDRKIKVMLPEKLTRESLISIFYLVDKMRSKNNIKSQAIYTIFDARFKNKVFVKNIDDNS